MSGFGDFCRQFRVLAWKNFILRRRHALVLLTELAIPVIIIILLGVLRGVIKPKTWPLTIPDSIDPTQTWEQLYTTFPDCRSGETLVWVCFSTSFCQGQGDASTCQMKKIAVAPIDALNADALHTAADFVSFAYEKSDIFRNYSTFTLFNSESDFENYINQGAYSQSATFPIYSSLIVFSSGFPSWDYTIRLNQTYYNGNVNSPMTSKPNVDISIKYGDQNPGFDEPYLTAYQNLGYNQLSDTINTYVATRTCAATGDCSSNKVVAMNTVGIAEFPSKTVKINGFWGAIGFLFALLMIMTLLYPLSNMIRSLVQEKESKLREGMAMMAMRSDALWTSWIFHFLCLFLPLAILLTLASGNLFVYSNPIFIFFYFFVFFLASGAYCIFISTLFSRSLTAAIIGCLVFFMGFFIYVGIAAGDPSISRASILAACLHPSAAFTFGTLAFIEYEDAQIGVTANTWKTSNTYPITFQDSLNMMFIDMFWLGIVSWYLAKIWPSEFGTHEPWYFIFLPSFWMGCASDFFNCCGFAGQGVAAYAKVSTTGGNAGNVPNEPVAESLLVQIAAHTCVDIVGLSKEFKTSNGTKLAVDNLSLTMFSGQITALLGHNGAGKSTLIGMLTGLFPPSSGTAMIGAHDLRTEMHAVRKTLGVCPQHDILFPDLTVEEHLELFAAFKGTPRSEIPGEVERMIQSVGLTEKRKIYSKNLSGGQKRKLSVAIAFIGGSPIVFLDEPTSGMDPYSRRFTWNVIRQHKEGRVIVLTTHFMDEADLLGDRIAIMGDGRLACCGSSLFLKKTFGVGYKLTIEKKNSATFDSKAMHTVVEDRIPEATLLTDVGTEMTFQLPFSANEKFQQLFETMDANKESLGLESYGISVTTLEEVFIKIAEGTTTNATAIKGREEFVKQRSLQGSQLQQESGRDVSAVADPEAGLEMATMRPTPQLEAYTSIAEESVVYRKIPSDATLHLFFRHLYASFWKRFLVFKRDIRSFIFLYFVPVIFLLVGVLIVALVRSISNEPNKVLNMHLYNPKVSDDYFPVPYTNASQFCYPNFGCQHVQGQGNLLENMLVADNLPVLAVDNAISVQNMSEYLFNNMNVRQASTFGAVTFTGIQRTTLSTVVNYIIHGNFTARHAGPMLQSIMINGVVSMFDPSVTVTANIHPLPLTKNEQGIIQSRQVDDIATFLLLAIPYIAASFASFVVREREIKAKHQQLVSGVSVGAFWLSTWIWDFVSYQPTCWMFIIIIASCPGAELLTSIHTGALGCLIGLLLLFGSAIAPFSYLVSMLFRNPSMTQIVMIFAMFILGLILGIVGIVLRFLVNRPYLKTVRYILAIFPPFALADGLHSMTQIQSFSQLELHGLNTYKPTDWEIAGLPLAFLAWESVLYFAIVLGIEYLRLIPSVSANCTVHPQLPVDNTFRDADVVAEETRIQSQTEAAITSSNILVKNAKKMYPGGKYAVRGVSVGIPKGECFGLLGINGAGKSTLLSILSGEILPTEGSMWLGGLNLATDIHNCRRLIGFCPQFDALFELLTGREHLQLYARIKGIVNEQIDEAVNAKICEMGLSEYADRAAGTYSGGNKRKLSVAIAMIGDPAIAFLDEPSTGMDPVARRFMWDVISDMVNRRVKCSVILTTHSMEECEALCTRIGIMVGGVMRCLGSAQHLRSLYGHGFQLEFGMVLPSGELLHQQSMALVQGAGKTVSNPELVGDMTLTRAEMVTAFGAIGFAHWADRINPLGSGVDLAHSFESNGSVTLKYLATWCLFEFNFEKLCGFLISSFGSFVLRERQNHKVRVEITSYVNQVAAVGPNGALVQSAFGPDEVPIPRYLSQIFGVIEANKQAVGIQEYSVSQTTLEQIFNQFAAQQEEEKGHATGL